MLRPKLNGPPSFYARLPVSLQILFKKSPSVSLVLVVYTKTCLSSTSCVRNPVGKLNKTAQFVHLSVSLIAWNNSGTAERIIMVTDIEELFKEFKNMAL